MNIRTALLPLVFVAGLAGNLAAASAQAPAPARIAIVNPAKVFVDMQETKDLRITLENQRKQLEQTENDKRRNLQNMAEQRNMLKADSPQFADKSKELTTAMIEFKAWTEITKQELERNQKAQMKLLFDKIQAATAKIAIQRNYDLVFADQRPEFPENLEQVTVDQLRALINQRNVLYAVPTVDLTADVTAQLDLEYKSTPSGANPPVPLPNPPAPAPTPGK